MLLLAWQNREQSQPWRVLYKDQRALIDQKSVSRVLVASHLTDWNEIVASRNQGKKSTHFNPSPKRHPTRWTRKSNSSTTAIEFVVLAQRTGRVVPLPRGKGNMMFGGGAAPETTQKNGTENPPHKVGSNFRWPHTSMACGVPV